MDVRPRLDPALLRFVDSFTLDFTTLTDADLRALRAQNVAAARQIVVSDAVRREDVLVPSPGAPDVPVRVYRLRRAGGGPRPCVVWMHGGGYVLGTHEMEDARFDRWCRAFGCVGLSVGYRLSPETPYPGPLEDCYAALAWVRTNAAALGVDPDRIGIGGASAGGGLAAGLALLARDRAEVPVAFQALVYPMLDDRQATDSSRWDVPIWPPAANRFGWDAYLRGVDRDRLDPAAAPARAPDLRGLAPMLVVVGALDGLVDEDVEYARRANGAGVDVDLHVYRGAPHGIESLAPGTALGGRVRGDVERWLGERLRQ